MLKKLVSKSLQLIDFVLWTDYHVKLENHNIGFHDPTYQFKKSEIAFVHIPRTGGTSLHNLLNQDPLSRFVNLNMHRPVSQLCDPVNYRYITLMCDPVDRVWSYYQMVLRNPPGFPYRRFAGKGLECFLEHCWEVRNMACRYYSGEVKEEPDGETLTKAFNNLLNFTRVINFNNFEKEVVEFLAECNIQVTSIPNEGKSGYARCNQNELNLIREYNKLDIELVATWGQRSASH